MARPARKHILIPEYRPLYAMSECFGPKHGPLTEPCPTPLTVIKKLLMQKGFDALTIMEVLKNPDGSTTTPVQLTLENYTLPYEEILNGGKMTEPVVIVPPETPEPVKPVIVQVEEKEPQITKSDEPEKVEVDEPVTVGESLEIVHGDTGATAPEAAVKALVGELNDSAVAVESTEDATPDTPDELPTATSGYVAAVDDSVEDEEPAATTVAVSEGDPYAGMTKAERKAAKRAAREAAFAEAAAADRGQTNE